MYPFLYQVFLGNRAGCPFLLLFTLRLKGSLRSEAELRS